MEEGHHHQIPALGEGAVVEVEAEALYGLDPMVDNMACCREITLNLCSCRRMRSDGNELFGTQVLHSVISVWRVVGS